MVTPSSIRHPGLSLMSRAIMIVFILSFAPAASAQDITAQPKPGQTVDVQGKPAFDPSKNVLDLVEAAIKRQDDLRAAIDKKSDLVVQHVKDLLDERTLRIDASEKLRAEYNDRLVAAEAKRIDAIRAVDVGAAANLATRTAEQATAIATVVNQTAEVLRNQVSRAAEDTRALVATTAATQLQNQQQQFAGVSTLIGALSTRLTTLEQTGAEGLGKQKFQDPALAALIEEVRSISRKQNDTISTNSGRGDVVGWIVGGLALLFMAIGTAVNLLNSRRKE